MDWGLAGVIGGVAGMWVAYGVKFVLRRKEQRLLALLRKEREQSRMAIDALTRMVAEALEIPLVAGESTGDLFARIGRVLRQRTGRAEEPPDHTH